MWDSWQQVSSNTYNTSWSWWTKNLPANGPFGIWKFEVEFNGQAYSHDFNYSAITSSEEILFDNRILKRVVDVLGRDVNGTEDTPLFYIYDDGTVEKRIIVE